ncbi:hypothetical protein OSTOST_02427 [Ostertagia ostertagi]
MLGLSEVGAAPEERLSGQVPLLGRGSDEVGAAPEKRRSGQVPPQEAQFRTEMSSGTSVPLEELPGTSNGTPALAEGLPENEASSGNPASAKGEVKLLGDIPVVAVVVLLPKEIPSLQALIKQQSGGLQYLNKHNTMTF